MRRISKQKVAILKKEPIDLLVGGEGREDSIQKSSKWMLGKEDCVTCGDLTLLCRQKRYIIELTQRQKSARS